ncbi:MAG: murein biosynthesis integral membrane protein MurJ, partial [Endomicrobia bacterium]|nr:murein biosynthesis integral membrane protein MurJ [Endomicrobiia bacterium]MCX7715991.1 murein biosynthesis integral membrane protein MurJ [Endomicrobiia bacterium]
MEKKQIMIKNMSFVSIGIMISRILGYFRDMLVASVFGAGFYADAFYAAFRIPNLFRRLFGENSLNAVFVPVFSEYIQKENKQTIEEFLSALTTVMLILLGVITFIGIVFAVPLTKIITWGFQIDKLLLTAKLLQIMFPYMILICLAALGLSILNCLKVFFVPAVSSSSLSISEIFFVLFIVNLLPEEQKVIGLAISVLFGGLLQFLINQIMVNKKFKIKIDFRKFFIYLNQPGVKKIYFLFIPVVFGFSIDQINALVDTLCASFLKEGSIAALYYSNRVMQLPLALFAISLTTVALPQMSQEVASNNLAELKLTIQSSLVNILLFILPASIGLIILGEPIIKTLFERGNFTPEATSMTYSCLAFYSSGLLFFSMTKILTSIFYAFKQPKYPVKIASVMLVLNAILNVILMQFLQVGGLALATSVTSLVATVLLFLKLKKYVNLSFKNMKHYFVKILVANICFVLFLLLLRMLIKNYVLVTISGIFFGVIFYFLIIKLLKIEEADIITKFVYKITTAISEVWTK